jgi:hypothetical protein
VYGQINKTYIETNYSKWENIQLINTNDDNLTRQEYSVMLKTPTFWENFRNWSHILIYQTDALLLRKIDIYYYDYDYVGAPWIEINNWCKYNGGNGGFSLRNVKQMILACEVHRYKEKKEISKANEDGFFCRCDSLKFIDPPKSDMHLAFAMETQYHKRPIGVHKLWWYANMIMSGDQSTEFVDYINKCLIYN